MIDLEEQIRASLHAYANEIEPGPPSEAFVAVTGLQPDRRRSSAWLVAAAAIVGLVVAVAVVTGRRDSGTVSPDPTVVGTWTVPSSMPLSPRKTPSMLWTGTEFIVWGGEAGNAGFRDGARYDPRTDTWRPMATNDRVRGGGRAVWAGDRMVVLSGAGGEAYDPVNDTWSPVPELPIDEADPGFSDAVVVGDTLFGVGIWPDPDEAGATRIRVWKFDAGRQQWFSQADAIVVSTFPGSFVSQGDQFWVHDLVVTTDGFVVWDGGKLLWSYEPGHARTISSHRWSVDGVQSVTLTAVDGEPAMLAARQTADSSELRLTTFTDGAWSPWTVLGDGGIGIPRAVPAGDDLVVLGYFLRGETVPTRIDLRSLTSSSMAGYPIDTVIDQSGVWSGSELLVCGGQRSTGNTSEISTSDPSPISNACAVWHP